jgi:glycosyltransferase involved in cell wall biosynthesis
MAVPPASKPLVVTVHDVDFLEHPERLSRRGRSFFPRAWRAAVDRADRIVVPSQTVAGKIGRHGVAAACVEVIPWGVDARRIAEADQVAVARRLGLPDRFVLWVGTAEPRKNLPGLVAAMQAPPLRSVPLVVAGPDGWGVDLDDTLRPLGDRALRLGILDRADLLSVYARATVFAYPSFDEGFGLPVLEAMAQGTPVVTSAGTATEEAAGGAAELVDPNDVASMSAGIGRLLDDGDAARRIDAGLERARAASWTATADRYAALFHALAGSCP